MKAGLRNAQAKDTQLDRPQRIVNRESILQMKADGLSIRHIAKALGISYGTVRKRLRQVS